jgi:P-type conjugative transfer protein TrbJ
MSSRLHLPLAIMRLIAVSSTLVAPTLVAHAQMVVHDPANLVQNALNAVRSLEQINNQVAQITNQIRQLENDALNLTRLGETFAPELMARLREMDQLISEGRGLALRVEETREQLETLYTGDYRNTDIGARAMMAGAQIDAARAALQRSLLVQAKATEQLMEDQPTLERLAAASAAATGSLSAQQATNELLAFQVEQSMRLQQVLVAQSRAEALSHAREMEVRAQGRAQHQHFFSGANTAHSRPRPWN